MEILKRLTGKTPRFFLILRNIGLTLTTISGLVIIIPGLPEWLDGFFNWYSLNSGVVMSVISQLTTIWIVEETTDIDGDANTLTVTKRISE